MRVEFEMEFSDLVMYNLMHQVFSVTVQLFYMIGPFVVICFAEEGESVALTAAMAILAYLAGWLLQVIFLVVFLLVGNNRTILVRKVIELQDDALFEESRYNKSFHYWPGILKAVRRPGFMAIYTTALAAHVIPNRAFRNEIERERFWDALNLKLKHCAPQ